jgi:succinoglycan biosynthesis transport protein ExoP
VWKQSFDVVVIDSAPIGPVIDSVIISNSVDKVVFVVRWASTARELVQQSVQRLPGHRKVAGIVLNQVNERLARKYGKHANAYYGSSDYKKYYSG